MTTLPPPEEHLAPAEHHPLPKTTWQRWRDWSGTNFVISVLIHLVVILLAMLLVVQVMQPREKPKFKAGPPSPNPPAEHSVKVKKSASMSVPTISKRITTTAANASVALPAMEMSAQMPDMMSGALSNLGESGLGAGAGTGGVGSLPPGGLTAFGFHKATEGTLAGTFFDLRQTSAGGAAPNLDWGGYNHEVDQFVLHGMNDSSFSKYFKSSDKVYSSQFYIPKINAEDGPAAFKVKNTDAWVIHYQGVIIPPVSGTYRFWGVGDDILTVQLDHRIVLNYGCITPNKTAVSQKFRVYDGLETYAWCKGLGEGKSFALYAGTKYPIDILLGHEGQGFTMAILLLEKDGEQYQKDSKGNPILPILRFTSRPFKKPTEQKQAPVFAPDTGYSVWKTEVAK